MASIKLLMENTVDVQYFRMDCHFNNSIISIHVHLECLDLLQGNDLKAQLMIARCGSCIQFACDFCFLLTNILPASLYSANSTLQMVCICIYDCIHGCVYPF